MLKNVKCLMDGLNTIKEERKDKYEILTDCISLHNILVEDYESGKFQIPLIEVIAIENCIDESFMYLTKYVEDLNEVNEMSKGIICLNPLFYILRNKTYNLTIEIAEILNGVIEIHEALQPVYAAYKKESL